MGIQGEHGNNEEKKRGTWLQRGSRARGKGPVEQHPHCYTLQPNYPAQGSARNQDHGPWIFPEMGHNFCTRIYNPRNIIAQSLTSWAVSLKPISPLALNSKPSILKPQTLKHKTQCHISCTTATTPTTAATAAAAEPPPPSPAPPPAPPQEYTFAAVVLLCDEAGVHHGCPGSRVPGSQARHGRHGHPGSQALHRHLTGTLQLLDLSLL